jgi:nitrate/nitrite-specific signal transduction histidine kinase
VGFDPGETADGHLGLAGIRARAERVGGHLVVRAAPGRGTEVLVSVPGVAEPPAGRVSEPGAAIADREPPG